MATMEIIIHTVKKRIFAVGGVCTVGTNIANDDVTHFVLTRNCTVCTAIFVHVTKYRGTYIKSRYM